MNKKSKIPKNDKCNYHGYQEWYHVITNELEFRVNMKNGDEIGYEECHHFEGTNFYIR
jgi:hypothetical protein